MNGIFGLESPVVRFLTKITDLLILNIAFLITCIPLFTIGAAITSMYEITLKMVKDEEAYILKSYWKAFKSNFKKSTGVWLVLVVMSIILIVDLYIAGHSDGQMWQILYVVIASFGMILWMTFAYIFPLQAKFVNTFKNTWKNAIFMAIRHLPTTIMVGFLNTGFIVCLCVNGYTVVYGSLVYLFIGFALIAYFNSIFLVKVFEKYYDLAQGANEEAIIESEEVDVQV